MWRKLLGGLRPAWAPILVTYFCYGASAVTVVAELFFQKDVLRLAPAEVAAVAFWVSLPWSMKMVAGVASDVHPILGSRRVAYLLVGAASTLAGYAMLASTVTTKSAYLVATLLVAVGFMIQDVVADALSVEMARDDEELGQIQTLGRMALLVGGISVGYLSGWLAGTIGTRATFAAAAILPVLVGISPIVLRSAPELPARPRPATADGPLGGGRGNFVMLIGLSYAALGIALESLGIAFAKEIVLVVSLVLLALLLRRVGITRSVAAASFVIFIFRATPVVGQGYGYWAVDQLGFDATFLGILAQVGAVLSLGGLLVFRKTIVKRPVSFTLLWVVVAGAVLYVPNLGLFYGLHEWLGISARTLAFIDTTISAPLAQLTMVPMLILIAKSAPAGAEATMFAIMASLMNLALSASQLFTEYLNELFAISQQDYSNLGLLMITVGVLGLLPLLALPLLWSQERQPATPAAPPLGDRLASSSAAADR